MPLHASRGARVGAVTQGTNGTKYTCEHAEFELGHGTGNLVLKRLELQAQLRLGAHAGGGGAGTLV